MGRGTMAVFLYQEGTVLWVRERLNTDVISVNSLAHALIARVEMLSGPFCDVRVAPPRGYQCWVGVLVSVDLLSVLGVGIDSTLLNV